MNGLESGVERGAELHCGLLVSDSDLRGQIGEIKGRSLLMPSASPCKVLLELL